MKNHVWYYPWPTAKGKPVIAKLVFFCYLFAGRDLSSAQEPESPIRLPQAEKTGMYQSASVRLIDVIVPQWRWYTASIVYLEPSL
jgi:hypothetical protein